MIIDPACPGFRDEFLKVSVAGSAGSLKLPLGQIPQKSKSPERITSPGFALC